MGKFSIDSGNLKALIKKVWAAFGDAEALTDGNENTIVVPGSIPILWVGDLCSYETSETRIVTVGTNPSSNEFLYDKKNNRVNTEAIAKPLQLADATSASLPKNARFTRLWDRFPGGETIRETIQSGDENSDTTKYEGLMNEYFSAKRKPYKKWFNRYERILNGLNATYYPNVQKTNVAVHIDLKVPVATCDNWSVMSNNGKKDTGILNVLRARLEKLEEFFNDSCGKSCFDRMIDLLKPEIMLVSANRDEMLKSFGWEIKPEDSVAVRFDQKYGCMVIWGTKSNDGVFCGPLPVPYVRTQLFGCHELMPEIKEKLQND